MGVMDVAAMQTYDLLRLHEPQIEEDGLWTDGTNHAIVCPAGPLTRTNSGGTVVQFVQAYTIIGVSLRVVPSPPERWTRLPERNLDAIVKGSSASRNMRELNVDLSMALPRTFPDFVMDRSSGGQSFDFFVARALTSDEQQQLRTAYDALDMPFGYSVQVASEDQLAAKPFRFSIGDGDIELIISRRVSSDFPRELRRRCEEDEDFWAANREVVMGSPSHDLGAVLGEGWMKRTSRCFVDASAFQPEDVRNYLSIYDQVVIAAPLGDKLDENCGALGIEKREMPELVATGRVKLVLPQSIDRYDARWLSDVLEAAPDDVMFSRRLAAATVIFSRARVPLLYAPWTVAECKMVLLVLRELARDHEYGGFLLALAKGLADKWALGATRLNDMGAMATMNLGVASIVSDMIEKATGRNLFLELTSAASSVEWGGALRATVIPKQGGDEYSEQRGCELIASLYSGTDLSTGTPTIKELNTVVEGLLSIARRDIPALEFAKAFGGGDIERFRTLATRLTNESVDPEELTAAIAAFNRAVKQYERKPDNLNSWNILGFLGLTVGLLTHAPIVGFGSWLAGVAVKKMKEDAVGKNRVIGRVVDQLNAEMKSGASDVVLVARLRRQLKSASS